MLKTLATYVLAPVIERLNREYRVRLIGARDVRDCMRKSILLADLDPDGPQVTRDELARYVIDLNVVLDGPLCPDCVAAGGVCAGPS